MITDSFARNFYDYNGPACSTIGNTGVLPNQCELATTHTQSVASVAALVKAAIGFVASPLLGSLSDRRGRKCERWIVHHIFPNYLCLYFVDNQIAILFSKYRFTSFWSFSIHFTTSSASTYSPYSYNQSDFVLCRKYCR